MAALAVTLVTLVVVASWFARAQENEARTRRVLLDQSIGRVVSLAASSDEEAFSYVLKGAVAERRSFSARTELSRADLTLLLAQSKLTDREQAAARSVLEGLHQVVLRAQEMFDAYDRRGEVPDAQYEAFEVAVDGLTAELAALDAARIAEQGASFDAVDRGHEIFIGAMGLAALLLSIALGGLLARRIARPLQSLSESVRAYGQGLRPAPLGGGGAAEVIGLAAAFQEMVAERERLDRQLQQAQRLEAIGQVAGGVAHDFNNVLSTVIMCGEEALEGLTSSHQAWPGVHDAVEAARRGSALAKQLLRFSRHQSNDVRVVSLNDAVQALQPMLKRLLGGSVALELSLEAGAACVRIDPSCLDQLLLNLVVNARDAMPDGGTVLIGTRTEGAQVSLSVEDDGTGMAPETAKRVFEPFFTTKPASKGTGLGLATVARIVREAQGVIRLETVQGKGTTLGIRFPSTASTALPSAA
jgi:signal transduction histidine kinase